MRKNLAVLEYSLSLVSESRNAVKPLGSKPAFHAYWIPSWSASFFAKGNVLFLIFSELSITDVINVSVLPLASTTFFDFSNRLLAPLWPTLEKTDFRQLALKCGRNHVFALTSFVPKNLFQCGDVAVKIVTDGRHGASITR